MLRVRIKQFYYQNKEVHMLTYSLLWHTVLRAIRLPYGCLSPKIWDRTTSSWSDLRFLLGDGQSHNKGKKLAEIGGNNVRSQKKEMSNLLKSEKWWAKVEKRADYNPWKLWSPVARGGSGPKAPQLAVRPYWLVVNQSLLDITEYIYFSLI